MQPEYDPAELRHYIGLAEASAMLRGRGGRRPSVVTMRRWANPTKGYRPHGWQGEPAILKTVRIGRDICTLPAWVKQFEAVMLAMGRRQIDPPPRTNRSKAAAQRQAARELERMGLEAG